MSSPDYTSVEEILFRGFLTLPATIGGVPVVFKSLNQIEQDLIDLCSFYDQDEDLTHKKAVLFLAYSTFFFKEINTLSGREDSLPVLIQSYNELPKPALDRLLKGLQILNSKTYDLVPQIQAYSYGAMSRQNWFAYRNCPLNSPSVTGIQGTDGLGLNYHQRLWVYFNSVEDIQEDYERDWSLAKFQASVHNHKGVKKIDQSDRQSKREISDKREKIYLGRGKDIILSGSSEIRISEESTDELLAQMKRAISGQKDLHDLIVEEHERKVKEKFLKEREDRLQRKRTYAESRAKLPVPDSHSYAVYDEKELELAIQEQNKRKHKALKEGRYSSHKDFEEKSSILSRWGMSDHPAENDKSSLLDDYYEYYDEDLDE
jgi:hypothetical protein